VTWEHPAAVIRLDVDDVVLGELIGEGGFARVYAARWRGESVCAKVAHARDDDSLLAEAAASERVAHPALVPVLAAGRRGDGRAYLVMPRIAGEDLAARLARGPLAVGDALAIVHAIGGALAAMHDVQLLHRDVKPENVMLAATGPVLIDLGLARDRDRSTLSTRVRGTHDHVAPERLFGEPATVASEVYELAALAWVMLTTRLPWPSGAGPAARRGIGELGIAGSLGAALDVVLRRALSTIPERRPQSIDELVGELAAAVTSSDTIAQRHTSSLVRAPKPATGPGTASVLGDTYRLLEVLGTGGSGKVFAAEHLRLPRRFAIKVLQADRDDADAHARFRREAEVIAALQHPRIVEVLDHDVDDSGVPFMVMQLLVGETLRQRLERGPLPPADVARLIEQAASAVDVAHAAGVVHRDLKPSNLFLRGADQAIDVTVLDFGISKLVGDRSDAVTSPRTTTDRDDATATGALLGTPGYAAPEQVSGDPIGPAADVFALAAIAYEALTGTRAFEAPTRDATLALICDAEPLPIDAWPEIDRVIRAGLAKDPELRIASASAFSAALSAAVRHSARGRRRVAGIAGVLAACGIAAVVMASNGSAEVAASTAIVAPVVQRPAPVVVPPPHVIRLDTDPAAARATLDGKPIGHTFELATGPHVLRVASPGRLAVLRTLDGATVGDELRIALPRAHTQTRPPRLRSLLER
jgi:eukaryotic-like serine/threonine-protein kinase